MKLISLNMEGNSHLDRVQSFITNQQPDIICLQEAPEDFQTYLHTLGYQTTFAPMVIREHPTDNYAEGVMFASLTAHTSTTTYYHKSVDTVTVPVYRDVTTCANVIIVGTCIIDDQTFTVGTTHVMVTIDGLPDDLQRTGIANLMNILSKHPPHLLCGDFNMPRGINDLYEVFTDQYTDTIPNTYTSSLDQNLHRLGHIADTLNAPIFDTYMVDYVFTQPPYTASDVCLEFGISDHAAVVAHLSTSDT
jgi:endonuclease/exonuclease/phosphatase family metal-dependent hydrolase